MDIESLERLTAVGKLIGLEGKDLQDFLRDERTAWRDKQTFERENMEEQRRER